MNSSLTRTHPKKLNLPCLGTAGQHANRIPTIFIPIRSLVYQAAAFLLIFLLSPSYVVSQSSGANAAPAPGKVADAIPIPHCPQVTYTSVPQPDKIALALSQRKRYRLVIGAGEFSNSPNMNRDFVRPTAEEIDMRLAMAGFSPLPSLAVSASPFLVGQNANKQAIKNALKEMAHVMNEYDYAVVYYVGHGMITPSGRDLTLAVYDRPVAEDEGIRVSDMLGLLTVGEWHPNIKEIPHILIVLDACFSGNAALGSQIKIDTQGNIQRLAVIENQIIPDQVAIMAATSDGDNSSAYELKGSGKSAFGFYFARALQEDWSCSDAWADGILTLSELKNYLTSQLKTASGALTGQRFTDGLMVPTILNKDENAFIAYSSGHYHEPGLRDQILELEIKPPPNQVAEVTLPNGSTTICEGNGFGASSKGCSVLISKGFTGKVTVVSISERDLWNDTLSDVVISGGIGSIIGGIAGGQEQSSSKNKSKRTGSIGFRDLISSKQSSLAGVVLTIK